MDNGPTYLSLEASIHGGDLADLASLYMGIHAATPNLPQLRGWRQEGSKLVKDSPAGAAVPPVPDRTLKLVHEDREADGSVIPASGDAPAWLALGYPTGSRDAAATTRLLEGFAEVCRELLEHDLITEAWVGRHHGGRCLPAPPVVSDGAHLLLTSVEAVGRGYSDPAAFWNAWDEVETFGDLRLCTRAMNAPGNPDYLSRVVQGQMAMARAAKPGLTEIYVPEFADGEMEVWDAGEPTLRPVGYSPAQKVFEFSGWTPPGTDLRVADLYNAWDIASSGQLPDGSPVDEVRVVFMDQEQAEQSGTLLQMAGAVVDWEDERGELHRLPAIDGG